MTLAAYTPRLCKFHCFNKNGLFSRDKGLEAIRSQPVHCGCSD
jgi:hypothetical protein